VHTLRIAKKARSRRPESQPDLEAVIKTRQAWLEAAPADHPDRPLQLADLGIALRLRFERTGALADLAAAIDLGRAAVAATTDGHPNRFLYLTNLGLARQARFGHTRVLADQDAAIDDLQAAVDATPDGHPEQPQALFNLGNAQRLRFQRTGALADVNAAIGNLRTALAATPDGHPYRTIELAYLGIALAARFERTGARADLDEAIGDLRAAVAATPDGHPDRAMYLSSLEIARLARFERTGARADLDAAIDAGQAAVDATPDGHPNRVLYLSNLGNAQRARFERTGARADSDAAIGSLRAAVAATPDGHPNRAMYLSSLGNAHRARFERTGALEDLTAAIAAGQGAVAVTPADHPYRAKYLSNLGIAWYRRFGRTGVLDDLDAALDHLQAAVDAGPAGSPERAAWLSNLGEAHRVRFGRSGALEDLDAAVGSCRAAVAATPADDPRRAAYLSNLAIALVYRSGRTDGPADLDAAIGHFETVLAATPADHPDRARRLSNSGNARRIRFARTGVAADLDAAIGDLQAALAAAPDHHPERTMYVYDLGVAEHLRYQRLTHEPAGLDAAIHHVRAAVDTAADVPSRAMYESALGIMLRVRFERAGAQADRAAALSAFARAAEAGSAAPSTRIMAACAAAELAQRSESARAAELLELAVRLLPELAPRFLRRGDQQYALRSFSGLAGDAAALVLAPAGPGPAGGRTAERALALLEAGRAVLLSQALDTRTDLTDLRRQHPGLAAQFTELREQLDQPVDGVTLAGLPGDETGAMALAGRPAGDRRRLAARFAAVQEEIRSLAGFTSFGRPPSARDLRSDAGPGPVVAFSISGYRSDALLLTADGVTSLPLPGLGWDALAEQISSFYQALQTTADPRAPLTQRLAAQATLSGVLEWLWDSAAGPVLHALGHDDQPPPDRAWPRVWWAPGGLLGRLPVHAAGYHCDPPGPGRRTVMDRVISSSTPTIRALRYARQHLSASGAVRRSLIVAMPVTPGLPDGGKLAHVRAEVDRIRGQLPDPVLLAEPGPAADPPGGSSGVPTRASVIAHLPGCAIVHFACHGATDAADPSQNLLLLHDHDRNPLTVASLAPVNLAEAQLAYLSACRTAVMSGTDLLDEAIHLTTAFQLAGFPCVVGTLWEISDQHAVDVAGSFYAALRGREGVLEVSQAARALHHAVRELRDQYPQVPSLWASYLHVGALSAAGSLPSVPAGVIAARRVQPGRGAEIGKFLGATDPIRLDRPGGGHPGRRHRALRVARFRGSGKEGVQQLPAGLAIGRRRSRVRKPVRRVRAGVNSGGLRARPGGGRRGGPARPFRLAWLGRRNRPFPGGLLSQAQQLPQARQARQAERAQPGPARPS